MQGPLKGLFIFAARLDLKAGAFSGGIEPPLKGFGAGCSGENTFETGLWRGCCSLRREYLGQCEGGRAFLGRQCCL